MIDADEVRFEVTLIQTPKKLTADQAVDLARNATPVIGRLWIMEGDCDRLLAPVNEIDYGTVGFLANMTERQLVDLCINEFPNFAGADR